MDESTQQVLAVAIGSPLVVAVAGGLIQYLLKRQDYARLDAVAARVAETNSTLIEGQREAARLLVENNENVRTSAADTKKDIKVIHAALNSDKTADKRELLTTTVSQRAFMKELIDEKNRKGHEPSKEAIEALAAIDARIEAINHDITVREEQQAAAVAAADKEAREKEKTMDYMLNGAVRSVGK